MIKARWRSSRNGMLNLGRIEVMQGGFCQIKKDGATHSIHSSRVEIYSQFLVDFVSQLYAEGVKAPKRYGPGGEYEQSVINYFDRGMTVEEAINEELCRA